MNRGCGRKRKIGEKAVGSPYQTGKDITPKRLSGLRTIEDIIEFYGETCFEARKVYQAAKLFERMINEGDTIWLGIAGAGIVGGLGGLVIDLMEKGFVDVICTTGAQVYHDLHFAWELPVRQINPNVDDNDLKRHGDIRIYDILIRDKETLEAQDRIIREFVHRYKPMLVGREISSADFNNLLGRYVLENSMHPERSFVASAAEYDVPVFWDSFTNHSIGLNLPRLAMQGIDTNLSPNLDIMHSAAIAYCLRQRGFIILGGGGPKNFIQQTAPAIDQIFHIKFEGADRGIQITTALERDGGLSGCTFREGVSWGKYKKADDISLVRIHGEYSLSFPLISAYVLQRCRKREHKRIYPQLGVLYDNLINDMGKLGE